LPENHQCSQIELARRPKQDTQPTASHKLRPYEYTASYYSPEPAKRRTYFSVKEVQHLAIATLLVIGVGLSYVILSNPFSLNQMGDYGMLGLFVVMFTASFFVHEMAHKAAAQRSGLWAEFRLTMIGAVLTLISTMTPVFKIISPGAVMVAGHADRKAIGKISIAGPATNIILSALFLTTVFLVPQHGGALVIGAVFNAWISLFNLIPFGMFDGLKVFLWSKRVWAMTFTASLILTLFSYQQYVSYLQ
jgi:Zn-dependent protease